MRKQANAGTHLRSCTDGRSVAAKGEWLTGAVSTHSALTCPVCDTALCSKDIGKRTVTALLARSALASVATPSRALLNGERLFGQQERESGGSSSGYPGSPVDESEL
jgi:hypothetical protein